MLGHSIIWSAGVVPLRPWWDGTLLSGIWTLEILPCTPPDGVGRVAALGNQQLDRPFQFWTPLNRRLGGVMGDAAYSLAPAMMQGANRVE